jgi:hypothetical protein
MNLIFTKYFDKLFVKQWILGLGRVNIKEIIRSKTFNQDIKWFPLRTLDHFQADPFLLRTNDGKWNILFEDFGLEDFYGKLSVLTFDNNFNIVDQKILLDTKSHLSYPFIFEENNKIYVFPEASQSGKLSCYEYNPVNQSLIFIQEIINLPLLDSTILKHKDKYWLFGTLKGEYSYGKLHIFFSNDLLGPYYPHPENPVKNSSNGTRPAGNFFEVDGILYRPSQNCENKYGESITINKINIISELCFNEEPYMLIEINKKNQKNDKIHTIHTFNVLDDLIAVDGMQWTFSPLHQWKNYLRNRRYLKVKKMDI